VSDTLPDVLPAAPASQRGDRSGRVRAPGPSRRGAALFQHRRWIHPLFVAAALIVSGGSARGQWAGIALLVVNLCLRLWAGRHLGGAGRVHARKAQERKVLVTSGPFAWVRNPLYLGNSLALAGACLLFAPAWLAVSAGCCSLVWYRAIIDWEECVNLGLYGDEYRAYLSRVPRLLPRPPRPPRRQAPMPLAPSEPVAGRHAWRKVLLRERGVFFSSTALIVLSLVLDRLGW
jgi:protein-S-isoprenylcysteine O-methyltransferase Ste14